jgi:hypothetical protein
MSREVRERAFRGSAIAHPASAIGRPKSSLCSVVPRIEICGLHNWASPALVVFQNGIIQSMSGTLILRKKSNPAFQGRRNCCGRHWLRGRQDQA